MSRRSNRGDDCAPAMFPFLAVLLCTIGALVLILVISVVHSHATAKRELDDEWKDRVEQAQEQSDYLETVSQELAARRDKIKAEMDRRRKELANVEDHIVRLKTQLDQLRSQIDRIESPDQHASSERQEREKIIASLREDIDAKRREIAEEIERAKNKKLAFSIIPYDGPNGTSRRPVYLECRADGVVIQPEGILIGIRDLRPPYGPGNPIDAALRILRTAYQKRDETFGLTIPPYPLLIVRPDGIHSYAMARAAMSGWDDQFGYELVDAEMDLVFPPGVPQLKDELVSTLDTARKRQEALVANLPREYVRARDSDEIDFDSLSPDALRTRNEQLAPQESSERDGRDWRMIDEMPGARVTQSQFDGTSTGSKMTPKGLDPLAPGQADRRNAETPKGLYTSVGSRNSTETSETPPQAGTDSFSQNGSMSMEANNANGSTLSGSSGSSQGTASVGAPSQNSLPSRANAFTSGSSSGTPLQSTSNADSPATPASEAMEKAIREQQEKQDTPRDPPNQRQTKFSQPDDESTGSIASKRGNGWANSGKDPKATPVTRPIRIVVLDDRWLIRKEGSETQFDAEIDLAQGPQQASAALEKAIRNRVDSWGLSLPGGYWCPSITMEPAVDAQQSMTRLQKMLDGSGVDIRVAPLQAPLPKPIRPEPTRPRR